ncbi:general transcription factor 3C polypeptide 3 isoform X1 [Sesamum indicum]|uniref:General transcription factor 3C polypeptide 3 isoform X1 n=2 Tax=Sesamum indicum TaxID=4182 RepID=A0A6I9UNW3_SESIN|nr:general transcription factor 3C polypeptide 3 isoform X1 [Sesamum indicum]XP_011100087.1 general transcription factor 3C polypeptide 3 isoform X1 [Sesamum indicum]XP_011100094.1 general transcription factor 3C polypeptide 3 isoform X1 [Sesamum indicum]
MGEHGGATPTPDANPSNNYVIPGATVEFDAVEHPQELELESELNLGEGEKHEEDGDNSEVSEEGDTDGEEAEYRFQFQGEMDPLSFAEEEDASGLLPYERFERIEQHYEVLASKKRPALEACTSELPTKKLRQEEMLGASFEEIMEIMNYGMRKKSRKSKQRGRRKGSKKKANPEVTRKLGDATLHYAHGRFEEAIGLLNEVILLAPNLSDPYHTLALIYTAMNEEKRALNFYMIAAHLTPKDASLWKLLVTRSIEQGDKRQANYCLNKAIIADPEDIGLRFHRASLYIELGEYKKAADSYEQISRLRPDNVEVLSKATQLYRKCGQHERAVCMLEDNLRNHVNDANLSVVDLLASILMEINAYAKALDHIEHAQQVYSTGQEIPLCLTIKAGVCHVHLGHLEKAEAHFNALKPENASNHPDLVIDVADSLVNVGQYESALKYYVMLEEDANKYNGYLHLKIARCYASLTKRAQAIEYYYKAVEKLNDSVDARLTLSSLLLEEDRDDEAISMLSPPLASEAALDTESDMSKLWWRNGKIKLKLSQIYKAKGSFEAYADVLFPIIHETLFIETVQQKVKARKRLSRGVLSERVKVLDDHQTDNVFHGFRPVASSADLSKASRAKRLLQKKAAVREAKRAAALAAGIDWKSDDSDDESPQVFREPPLPDLLKEEGNHDMIVDLCKSLSSLRRYWDALEIINLSLKLECNTLSVQRKEELRTLGAQIAYNISDPAHGWDCVRYIVSRHPYSFSAWNCYYKGILRNNRIAKHNKFLHNMRVKHKDSVPPILISAHQFTMISQHQAAAREYLEAHKLMPDNPFINLCAGTALINLALGHRLQNKHQTLLQGLAFLYNNSRLCGDSQEALYNIARAYHHVGLVSLAATYYEKVLAIREKDYPIPVLPNENQDHVDDKKPGYCDLRREAAYNLHLIYKKSGALDLARQVLKDHVVL